MIDLHHAVRSVYPTAVTIHGNNLESLVALDLENNNIVLNKNAVSQEFSTLTADFESKEYQRLRAAEYPTIGDQLDALWKGGDAAAEMLAKVQAVKNKYPKGTE